MWWINFSFNDEHPSSSPQPNSIFWLQFSSFKLKAVACMKTEETSIKHASLQSWFTLTTSMKTWQQTVRSARTNKFTAAKHLIAFSFQSGISQHSCHHRLPFFTEYSRSLHHSNILFESHTLCPISRLAYYHLLSWNTGAYSTQTSFEIILGLEMKTQTWIYGQYWTQPW